MCILVGVAFSCTILGGSKLPVSGEIFRAWTVAWTSRDHIGPGTSEYPGFMSIKSDLIQKNKKSANSIEIHRFNPWYRPKI